MSNDPRKTESETLAPAAVGPAEERWLELDGLKLRYLFCPGPPDSKNPPILLIHGILGYSFSWRFNFEVLAGRADVFAPDLPGVGYSGRPLEFDCSLRGFARYLLRAMDALNLRVVDLVGTSHGGAIAMMLAAEAPERFRRLVLVAPVNPWSRYRKRTVRLFSTRLGAMAMRWVWPHLRFLRHRFLAQMYGDPRRIAPGAADAYAAPLRVPETCKHLLKIVHCWRDDLVKLETALPRIAEIPTLLIWGTRDRLVSPRSAYMLQKQFTHAELALIEGVGHLPYEEVPDDFNRILVEYLNRGI